MEFKIFVEAVVYTICMVVGYLYGLHRAAEACHTYIELADKYEGEIRYLKKVNVELKEELKYLLKKMNSNMSEFDSTVLDEINREMTEREGCECL